MNVMNYVAGYSGMLTVIGFGWLLVITIWIVRIKKVNNALVGSVKSRDLKEIVLEYMGKVGEAQIELSKLSKEVHTLQINQGRSIQKIGLVRFSAFEDTGGDQSFSLVLLDGEDSGVAITAQHGRDRSRVYSKALEHGKSHDYALSDEEEQAVQEAIQTFTEKRHD